MTSKMKLIICVLMAGLLSGCATDDYAERRRNTADWVLKRQYFDYTGDWPDWNNPPGWEK